MTVAASSQPRLLRQQEQLRLAREMGQQQALEAALLAQEEERRRIAADLYREIVACQKTETATNMCNNEMRPLTLITPVWSLTLITPDRSWALICNLTSLVQRAKTACKTT